jgi:RNA polymerase sigma-70 factor (ECF subfamily)
MVSAPLTESFESEPSPASSRRGALADRERLTALTTDNFQFIWRSLRRLGLRDDLVDDAAQQVFEIAARKLDRIEPGRERAFVFKTALWVATEQRRTAARSRRIVDGADPDALPASQPDPEVAAGLLERRRLLDEVLDAMPLDLRTVFVLFELEGLATDEIAELVGIPVGTAASRLRRGREEFQATARRLRARMHFRGGSP